MADPQEPRDDDVVSPPPTVEATEAVGVEGIIDGIRTSIGSPSTALLQYVEGPVRSFVRGRGDAITEKEVKALLSVLSQSLPRFELARARHAVQHVVADILASGPAARTIFATVLPKLVVAYTSKGASGVYTTASSTRIAVLGWTLLPVRHCASKFAEVPSELSSVIGAQAAVLESFLSENASVTGSAVHAVSGAYAEGSTLIKSVLENIAAKDSAARWAFLAGGIVQAIARHGRLSTEWFNVHHDKLVEAFAKHVLSTKAVLPVFIADDFAPAVATFTAEDYEQHFSAIVLRQLLRSPEVILPILPAMLRRLAIDTGRILVASLLAPLRSHLAGTNELLRNLAVSSVEAAFEDDAKDADVLAVLQVCSDALMGVQGRLPSWEQRMAFAHVMRNASRAKVDEATVAALAARAIDMSLALAPKENHEPTLLALIEMMSGWQARLPELHAPLKQYIESLIKGDRATLRRAGALLIAHLPDGSLPALASSVEQLAKLYDAAAKSGQNNGEAVVLAFALVKLASKDAAALAALTKRGFFAASSQYLVQERVFSKLAEDDMLPFVDLLVAVLSSRKELGQDDKACVAAAHALCWAALFSTPKVRRAVRDAIPGLYERGVAPKLLLDEMRRCICSCVENKTVARNASDLLLEVTAPTNVGERLPLILDSILVAHHSACSTSQRHGRQLWLSIVKYNNLHSVDMVSAHAEAAVKSVLDASVTGQVNNGMRAAALGALETLLSLSDEAVTKALVNFTVAAVAGASIGSVSETDIGIFRTDPHVLFVDVLAKKDTAMQANAKRESRAYSYEDQVWEEQLRQELRAKQAKKPRSKEEEALFQAQLAKEAGIRARVREVYDELGVVLNVLTILARRAPEATHVHLPALLESVVLPLLASSLTNNEAVRALTELTTCLWIPLRKARFEVAYGVLRALEVNGLPQHVLNRKYAELAGTVLQVGQSACEVQGPMPAQSFYFLFPIIRATLANTSLPDELHASALSLLKVHTVLGTSPLLPRRDMVESLLFAAVHYTSQLRVVQASLEDLCEHIDEAAEAPEVAALLDGVLSEHSRVRSMAVSALQLLPLAHELSADFIPRVWNSRHDDDEAVAAEATKTWEYSDVTLPETYADSLIALLLHNTSQVSRNASKGIAAAVELHPATSTSTQNALFAAYKDNVKPVESQFDEFGRKIRDDADIIDFAPQRFAVATALREAAKSYTEADARALIQFLISVGFADTNEDVRAEMLEAGLQTIRAHGQAHVQTLLAPLEEYLNTVAPASEVHDRIRESVIVLLGELGQFLKSDDPRIPNIVSKLVAALSTPSEQVQSAVGSCLPPLVKSLPDGGAALAAQMIELLFEGKRYGDRRGAAYGLAGVIKGRGIGSLKEFNVMQQLKDATESKVAVRRQGALFAYETLSVSLGRLFEPYVIQILPNLLAAFGDSDKDVREAASDASKAIMGKLSAHAVKLVLPAVLTALEDKAWRTKQNAVEVLGSMAYMAPKQLSLSLPAIVPKLTDVLSDSHSKVVKAGKDALMQIGSVIKNPEVQVIVPALLGAVADPNNKTADALDALLKTAFVHVLDPPSLALIIPIIQRALKERMTEVKKMSAQILGNMCSLADQKDLQPYLPHLLPGLKVLLVDPIPEVRKAAAMALGTMVNKMGEDAFEGLVPWLLSTVRSDVSSVDRSGAAQGLSEVLSGLPLTRLEALLPEIVANCASPLAHVREGFLSLFVYLPGNLQERFGPYLKHAIAPVLRGLADESESVRDIAMRSGQMIVSHYASSAVELLLPELQRGLFDENWRIRQSSVTLLGDLLYRITGATGKTQINDNDEEGGIGTEEGRAALIRALGLKRRNIVLASLYILRSDVNLVVRQASLHVWKTIVANTPRTMRETLAEMTHIVIECLASQTHERRQVGARALGELVRKLGDRVLPELMPVLEEGLESTVMETRQGVCVGLSEIMNAAGRELVNEYIDIFIPAVRSGLCDESADVREPAAAAFNLLYGHVGRPAVDGVLPLMLSNLNSEYPEVAASALEGLQQITYVRPTVVFPVLIEQLLSPLTPSNARALATLIPFAGRSLSKYLITILNALLKMDAGSAEDAEAFTETVKVLLVVVEDDESTRLLLSELFEISQKGTAVSRRAAVQFLSIFCKDNKSDKSMYLQNLFRIALDRANDEDSKVSAAAIDLLGALTGSIKKEELPHHIPYVRKMLKHIVEEGKEPYLRGFSHAKGIVPLVPMFLQGLSYGSADTREQAALGLGDLIRYTPAEVLAADALKIHIIQLTGPLIRVLNERFTWQLKVALLQTLSLVLAKVSASMKPFLPQLQSSFVKALNDTNAPVRQHAAEALGLLITLQPRIDMLLTELQAGTKAAADSAIRETFLRALFAVLVAIPATAVVSAPVRDALTATLTGLLGDNDDGIRRASGFALGALMRTVPEADAPAALGKSVLGLLEGGAAPQLRQGVATCMLASQQLAPAVTVGSAEAREAFSVTLLAGLKDDKVAVSQVVVRAAGLAVAGSEEFANEYGTAILSAAASAIADRANDYRRAAAIAIKGVAKARPQLVADQFAVVLPGLMVCVKEKNVPVKLAAERALVHTLQLKSGDAILKEAVAKVDAETGKALADYYKRVLSKVAAATGEESDDDTDDISFGVAKAAANNA